MLAQNDDRNELIAMLAWQLDMGIDEALLDHPQADAVPLRLDQLLAVAAPAGDTGVSQTVMGGAAPHPSDVVKMPNLASVNSGLVNPAANPALTNSEAVPPEGKINADGAALAGITSLADLQSGLAKLDDCPLKHTASNLCFADGNPGARLMIIGEAPGRDEDRMGVPFVGADGQLLDKMIASIGLDRASVYLTNLLPWRPPGNRSPTDEETAMLLPWLFRHVQLAKPEFVLLLGGAAAKLVLGSHDGIMKLRGRWRDVDFGDGVARPVLASLHPAYLLRSPAQKRLAFEDLLLLTKRLGAVQSNDETG
ncbi:uracil-DNA glycosylase [Alphaproteobacteria bacterium]|nr:uracil-DNA glycosylase [Alphaproteobacteria bacterium]